jgi:hypothetical protein
MLQGSESQASPDTSRQAGFFPLSENVGEPVLGTGGTTTGELTPPIRGFF